jgi:hypothetical protein
MNDASSSLAESVKSSFLELTAAAETLNQVSDALGKAVSDIDETLRKLNLGITAWVRISYSGPDYPDDSYYSIAEIGYAKIASKWGVALKTRSGDERFPEEQEGVEVWLFNEAPRSLRLKAIEKIPDLLRKLSQEATEMAKALEAKVHDAQAVSLAIAPPKFRPITAKTEVQK